MGKRSEASGSTTASTCPSTRPIDRATQLTQGNVARHAEGNVTRHAVGPSEVCTPASKLCLSEAETREYKKIDKKLREISKLEALDPSKLDKLQLEKINQKEDLRKFLVFQKVENGYQLRS